MRIVVVIIVVADVVVLHQEITLGTSYLDFASPTGCPEEGALFDRNL